MGEAIEKSKINKHHKCCVCGLVFGTDPMWRVRGTLSPKLEFDVDDPCCGEECARVRSDFHLEQGRRAEPIAFGGAGTLAIADYAPLSSVTGAQGAWGAITPLLIRSPGAVVLRRLAVGEQEHTPMWPALVALERLRSLKRDEFGDVAPWISRIARLWRRGDVPHLHEWMKALGDAGFPHRHRGVWFGPGFVCAAIEICRKSSIISSTYRDRWPLDALWGHFAGSDNTQ